MRGEVMKRLFVGILMFSLVGCSKSTEERTIQVAEDFLTTYYELSSYEVDEFDTGHYEQDLLEEFSHLTSSDYENDLISNRFISLIVVQDEVVIEDIQFELSSVEDEEYYYSYTINLKLKNVDGAEGEYSFDGQIAVGLENEDWVVIASTPFRVANIQK
jgi:hypothetical protein